MNTPDENTQPTKIDESQDRLIDRSLTELLGNETPPDLSSRILVGRHGILPAPIEHTKPKRFSAARWLAAGIAASLLVGATLVAILPIGKFQTAAKVPAKQSHLATSSRSERLGGQTENTPLSGPTANDGIALESTDASLLTRSLDQRLTPGETQLHTRKWCILATVKKLNKSLEASKEFADQTCQ